MKKFLSILMATLLTLSLFSACGGSGSSSQSAGSSEVTTDSSATTSGSGEGAGSSTSSAGQVSITVPGTFFDEGASMDAEEFAAQDGVISVARGTGSDFVITMTVEKQAELMLTAAAQIEMYFASIPTGYIAGVEGAAPFDDVTVFVNSTYTTANNNTQYPGITSAATYYQLLAGLPVGGTITTAGEGGSPVHYTITW